MNAEPGHPRLRILLHIQHGEGIGHYVRTSEIAKALAQRHDVMLSDGGRPVPRGGLDKIAILPLPRVARRGSEYFTLESADLSLTMKARRVHLRQAVETFHPDVVIVEHYPFSKWTLTAYGGEVIDLIEHARAANTHVKIICSIRDIQPRTRREVGSDEDYAREVTSRLRAQFDAMLVHGDPAFSWLEEEFPFLAATGVRIAYTGIVSEKPDPAAAKRIAKTMDNAPFILASVGGGVDRSHLLRHTLEAWEGLRRGPLAGWKLVLSPGLAGAEEGLAERAQGHDGDVILRGFGADFLAWMQAAELSVSCAGYNTCANLFETRRRAVLAPDKEMGDQRRRATLMAARGMAVTLAPGMLSVSTLSAAILQALAAPPPQHAIALDGAARTRQLIEEIAAALGSLMSAAN